MNRLMDHLPSFYEEIKEFRELTSTGSFQLDQLSAAINRLLADQYVLSSSEPAIARREKVFRIIPDLKNDTLDFRRRRVLSRMQSKPPYVLEYLRRLIDSIAGEKSHTLDLDVVNYHLEVLFNMERVQLLVNQIHFYKEITSLLDRIVPLNMTLGLTTQRKIQMNLSFGGIVSSRNKIQIRPAAFKMPVIQQTKYYAGFISYRSKTVIKSEV